MIAVPGWGGSCRRFWREFRGEWLRLDSADESGVATRVASLARKRRLVVLLLLLLFGRLMNAGPVRKGRSGLSARFDGDCADCAEWNDCPESTGDGVAELLRIVAYFLEREKRFMNDWRRVFVRALSSALLTISLSSMVWLEGKLKSCRWEGKELLFTCVAEVASRDVSKPPTVMVGIANSSIR